MTLGRIISPRSFVAWLLRDLVATGASFGSSPSSSSPVILLSVRRLSTQKSQARGKFHLRRAHRAKPRNWGMNWHDRRRQLAHQKRMLVSAVATDILDK